ncbi:MAG: hypothetical protein ACI36T_06320 [Eggerthellaceae bacterium]
MDITKIIEIVAQTGFPVHFADGYECDEYPQLFVTESETVHFYADNRIYATKRMFETDLTTSGKDPEAESKVESILDANGIAWKKGGDRYEKSSGLVRIRYTFWGL